MANNSLWVPAWLKQMGDYANNPNTSMYGMWNSPTPGLHPNGSVTPGEGGVDLPSPTGTPVFALGDGPIVGAGYWKDKEHGVVTTRVDVPGFGQQDIYYQHIYLDKSIQETTGGQWSQNVKRGQLLGTTGGYGEVEVGFNAQWGGIWGSSHPGAWVKDPRPMILALMAQGKPAGVSSGLVGAVGSGLSTVAQHIAPDVSVAELLAGIDVALELQNPFTSGALANGSPTFAFGIGGASANIPDPVAYLSDLGENVINDLAALIVRGGFILIGILILWALAEQVSQGVMNKALEPIGGTQGAMQLAKGLM